MKDNVLFITNGNLKIGYGHISRDLVIAEVFRKRNWDTNFLIQSSSPFLDNILREHNNVLVVDSFKQNNVIHSISNLVKNRKLSVIIIDLIEEEYVKFRWLRKKYSDILIVSITLFLFDLKNRYEHMSFFPDMEKITTKVDFLLYSGPSYLVFRDEFKNRTRTQRKNANKVLISMGGTDPYGLTLKATKSLVKFNLLDVTILLSELSPFYDKVKALIYNKENIRLINKTDNISILMSENDLLILNGGLTRYEACISQLPFIAISIHKLQYNITKRLTDIGIGINLGINNEISEMTIQQSVSQLLDNYNLRVDMGKRMKSLFDTKGATRIFNIIAKERYSNEKNN